MAIIDKVNVGGSTYDIQDARGDELAVVDGYYEQMTVGNSEQLVSTVGVEDKVPYNFRTSGGSADIGDREVDKLVGGTVAFNQWVQNGNFENADGWNKNGTNFDISVANNIITGTVTGSLGRWNAIQRGIQVQDGHKLLIAGYMQGSVTNFDIAIQNFTPLAHKTIEENGWNYIAKIGTVDTGSPHNIQFQFGSNYSAYQSGDTIKVKNVVCFDLTQMFGSTIADYIYTLETATPGAGVNLFRSLFPKPYYEFNAGELMSVKTTAHNMVGFNAWDEDVESGSLYADTGTNANSDTAYRSKNHIPVLPNTTYYVKNSDHAVANSKSIRLFYYDKNKTFISSPSGSASSRTFVTPENAYYMRFFVNEAISYYGHDICINLSWDGERDGEYEPYSLHSYPLDDVELRGIPKLDADNRLYYDGDTYEDDGTVTRRYGIVDLGTLSWIKESPGSSHPDWYIFFAAVSGAKGKWGTYRNTQICSKYPSNKTSGDWPDMCCAFGTASQNINISDSSKSNLTVDEFATAMSGVYLVYELETPTTESADSYQNPQIVNDFGTEEYVDSRTVAIPVGHETTYQANLRAKLEMAPNSPSGDGDYIVRQTNGQNVYVPITFPADELPSAPSDNGTYHLSVTVANGTATYSWESDS